MKHNLSGYEVSTLSRTSNIFEQTSQQLNSKISSAERVLSKLGFTSPNLI